MKIVNFLFTNFLLGLFLLFFCHHGFGQSKNVVITPTPLSYNLTIGQSFNFSVATIYGNNCKKPYLQIEAISGDVDFGSVTPDAASPFGPKKTLTGKILTINFTKFPASSASNGSESLDLILSDFRVPSTSCGGTDLEIKVTLKFEGEGCAASYNNTIKYKVTSPSITINSFVPAVDYDKKHPFYASLFLYSSPVEIMETTTLSINLANTPFKLISASFQSNGTQWDDHKLFNTGGLTVTNIGSVYTISKFRYYSNNVILYFDIDPAAINNTGKYKLTFNANSTNCNTKTVFTTREFTISSFDDPFWCKGLPCTFSSFQLPAGRQRT